MLKINPFCGKVLPGNLSHATIFEKMGPHLWLNQMRNDLYP